MSIKDLLSGYVLQPSRNATSNSQQTASSVNGVLRDVSEIPLQHITLFGETLASQYRSAYLEQPYSTEEEYLIWASNNSNLSLIEDSSWSVADANLFFGSVEESFNNEVGSSYTSTNQIYIEDINSRSIAGVSAIFIRRGDYAEIGDQPIPKELLVNTHFTYQFGIATLTDSGKALLGGGLSEARGDGLVSATYYLEKSKFWWTRNDAQATRFSWNDKESLWKPLQGQGTVRIGKLLPNESYTLSPKTTGVGVGELLKGDPSNLSEKAILRIGATASENATPVKVKVVADDSVTDEYDFASDPQTPDAILGQFENKLLFNPTFVLNNAGNVIWYSFEGFDEASNGIVGKLSDTSHFLCPIPSIFERPMVKVGNRKHLQALPVNTEVELDALVIPNERTFGWCASTGRLKFHNDLLSKVDQSSDLFDLNYIGADVVYDGVCLCTEPIETAKPVALSRTDDYFTIPFATQGDLRTSGVLRSPDGTGITPTNTTPITERPSEGLQKNLEGIGDFFFFCRSFALRKVIIENREEDIPYGFFRKKGTAYVALDTNKVFLSNRDLKNIGNETLYFIQADLSPAKTFTSCIMPSRRKETYTVRFGDTFVFAVKDSVGTLNTYSWSCSLSGTYSAKDMANLLNTETGLLASGDGKFSVVSDYLCIETTSLEGRIEIGFGITTGTYADRNLSGCGSLGFNAGWVIDSTQNLSYLNDSGFSFGVFRSPKDKTREKGFCDFKQIRRVNTSIGEPSAFYFQNLDKSPLEDEIGFQPNVFFTKTIGLKSTPLQNYTDIVHNFPQGNFIWVAFNTLQATQVLRERNTFNLVAPVIPQAMLPQLGTYIAISENGTGFASLENETNYLLRDGQQGLLELIDIQNEELAEGARGSCSGSTFQESVEYADVQVGQRLKILSGENKGSYFITQVTQTNPLSFEVKPSFLANTNNTSWIIFEGVDEDSYDPSLICDKIFVPTSHLEEEPFKVRVLSNLGEAGGTGDVFSFEGGELLSSGRNFFVQVGSQEYPITVLSSEKLGSAANNSITVVADEHLQENRFALRVGTTEYSHTLGNLSLVSTFTSPLSGNVVEVGEYGSGIEGQVQFGEGLLSQFGGQEVLYLQQFRDTEHFQTTVSSLYSPVGISGTVYLIEEYVTNVDVTVAPITGNVSFNEILKKNKQVEVDYFLANTDGTRKLDENNLPIKTKARLTVSYKLQPTVRIDKHTYSFNAENRTIDREATTRVWVGARLMNLRSTDVTIDFDNNTLNFILPVEEGKTVQINYFAYESSGEGRSYKTPSFPIWRPPFKLNIDTSEFVVTGDRTSEYTQGKMLFVDGGCFYITGASHQAGFTTVSFTPTTTQEHGSNAPASEQPMFLTDKSVDENNGFWYDANHIPFESIDKGMNKIILRGNHTEALTINHIFELSGDPYLVEDVELSDNGEFTHVTMQSIFITAYEKSEDTLRISTRPVYFEKGTDFLAKPFVSDKPFELVLAGSRINGIEQPARTLLEDVEYKISPDTGVISFKPLFLDGINRNERLYFYSVVRRNISPKMENKNLIVPVIAGRYLSAIIPLPEGYITANFKHYSPDNFFSRVIPNSTYMGEVAKEFSSSMSTAHSVSY